MIDRQSETRRRIRAMGQEIGPSMLAAVQALYLDEQAALAAALPPLAVDRPYGDDPRQRLDLYRATADTAQPLPVLLFVHGGGFVRGEKASPDHPYNAHVGRWAARHGMIGAVMNYRLAPDHVWPAGGEDVGAAIDWLRAHAGSYGGDPDRLVVMGTSAGAVHVATHIRLRPDDPGVAGAILLSGLYGFTPLDPKDMAYYGEQRDYAGRCSLAALIATHLPLLVAWAELDPPRFQHEALRLLSERLDRHGRAPAAFCGNGHNHFSLAAHIGGSDTRLSDAALAFVADLFGADPR